jgi:hypothetical protein
MFMVVRMSVFLSNGPCGHGGRRRRGSPAPDISDRPDQPPAVQDPAEESSAAALESDDPTPIILPDLIQASGDGISDAITRSETDPPPNAASDAIDRPETDAPDPPPNAASDAIDRPETDPPSNSVSDATDAADPDAPLGDVLAEPAAAATQAATDGSPEEPLEDSIAALAEDPTADDDDYLPAPGLHPTPTEDGTIGILNFEDQYGDDTLPKFTEPSTLAALKRLFIEPTELLPPTNSDLTSLGIPDFADVRRKILSMYANRRRLLIREITDERESVISESKRAEQRSQTSSGLDQARLFQCWPAF